MDSSNFHDTIGQVASYTLSIGDSIDGTNDFQSGIRLHMSRGDRSYAVSANPSLRYFSIEYTYRMTAHLKSRFENDQDLLGEVMDEFEIEDEEIASADLYGFAAGSVVKEINQPEANEVMYGIRDYVAKSDCRLEWLVIGDSDVWDGFKIRLQIYPYEDDFSVRYYDEGVQTLLNVGELCRNHILDQLNLPISQDWLEE